MLSEDINLFSNLGWNFQAAHIELEELKRLS